MSSLFYSRYIPPESTVPEKSSGHDVARTRPVKKRKKSSNSDTTDVPLAEDIQSRKVENSTSHTKSERFKEPQEIISSQQNFNLADSDLEPAPRKTLQDSGILGFIESTEKKESKKKQSTASIEESEHTVNSGGDTQKPSEHREPEQDTRHRKIRSKFEKSAQVAAKITEERNAAEQQRQSNEPEDQDDAPVESHGLVPLPQPPEVPDAPGKFGASALPDWLADPLIVNNSDTIALDSLSLSPSTTTPLKQKGYENAFAVQAAVVPMLLPGPQRYSGDICISAATGSGKTLAYILPMVESLRGKPVTKLRGLIVVPTRELVVQVRESLELCSAGSGLKVGTAVGNKSLKDEQDLLVKKWQRYDPDAYRAEQEKEIDEDEELMNWDFDDQLDESSEDECPQDYVIDYKSKVEILICTPGRLVDHMQSTKGFNLDHVEWLVIDEADRLLDESFQQWVDIVVPALDYQAPLQPWEKQLTETFHMLHQRELRKIIFSATMTRDISKLMALRLRKPMLVVLESDRKVDGDGNQPAHEPSVEQHEFFELPATLQEFAIPIKDIGDKPLHLIDLLERENAFATLPCNTPSKSNQDSLKDDSTSSSGDDSSSSGSTSSDSSSPSPSPSSSLTNTNPSKPTPKTKPQPASTSPTHGTLIFTSTSESALRLTRLLSLLRPQWTPQLAALTKTTSAARTRHLLSSFRTHTLSLLIATDRASRGLDIPALAHVINYDMPSSVTSYVHRVGRTARAGMEGKATTFVGWSEGRWFWREVGRGGAIRRGGRKVRRVGSGLEAWGEGERRGYEEALGVLGREVTGEGSVRVRSQSRRVG